jgi:hypothetical protein
MNKKQFIAKIALFPFFSFLLLACGSVLEPSIPTLIPTAIRPEDEQRPTEALALLPTFTNQPDFQPEVAGLTPEPFVTSVATTTPILPTRTPTRTATPTITPTSPPTFTPRPTAFPTITPTTVNTPDSQPGNGDNPTHTPPPPSSPPPPPPPWTQPTPHPYPQTILPRQGFAATLYSQDNLTFGQWRYIWSDYVPPEYQVIQHIPMVAGGPRSGIPTVEELQESDSRTPHDYWLALNECEHQNQCNGSPQSVADFYHNVVDRLYAQGGDPNARLIVGGVNAHPCGIKWLREFVTYYQDTYGPLPHAGWHFHLYPEIRPQDPVNCTGNWIFDDALFPTPQAAFELWKQHANNALEFVQTYGHPSDEVWFTEMGCLNYGFHQVQAPVCQADGFMSAYVPLIMGWLNGEGRWVTRYAWYTDWSTAYFKVTMLLAEPFAPDYTGPLSLTEVGQFYANLDAAAALPLPWP